MSIAIVTGASSGLGTEFVATLAKRFGNLEELWLISRSAEKLNRLTEVFPGAKLRFFPLDLQKDDSFAIISSVLSEKRTDIKLLINNAGFGTLGDFCDCDTGGQAGMVRLNCEAQVKMTSICLPYMKKGSAVINIASIASFAPNPRMTVYSSTKAFMLSFSKGLRYELKPKGINVLAVCPGPMSTAFLETAGITHENSKTFRVLPYCNPAKVAEKSVKKALCGHAVYTPRFFFKFYRVVAKILPHNWIMPLSKA